MRTHSTSQSSVSAPQNYNVRMTSEIEDPRTYFAAERTFLAWIRTGLGLMGIGFAVARFGLFLREMRGAPQQTSTHGLSLSVYLGVGLVLLGVVVNLSAVAHHVRTVRQLRTGTWMPGRISTEGVALAMLLAALGVAMGIYLLFLR